MDFISKAKPKKSDDDNEQGEETTSASVAGGGHSARQTGITKHQITVSKALRSFLVDKSMISGEDFEGDSSSQPTGSLKALLEKPHIDVPAALTDRSHPLPEYFISSSHNTYLMAHQLFGTSSAEAYEVALHTGSRCVEIDAWDGDDNPDEPKVTHGYTLVSNITFRSVCEIIRDVHDKESAEAVDEQGYRAAPILISLENHCGPHGQLRLVQLMTEIWGHRLLSKSVREEGHDEQGGGQHVRLEELGSKIVVIVEHHIPGEIEDDDSSSSDEDESEKQEKEAYRKKKQAAPATIIIPELANLGVYAQSVKPSDNSWYNSESLTNGPHHHLINVSESGLATHMGNPNASSKIGVHNAHHLMRVFPKGTRISSKNLQPVPFWGIGAQICALNWQTFSAGMQVNEALFSGSDGYVLKPAALRHGGSGKLSTGRMKKLSLHIAGATHLPVPEGTNADDIKPYVTCMLIHPDHIYEPPPKRKTSPYKKSKLDFLHRGEATPPSDPVWDEVLEWEYEENELIFLRILIKSDDSFAANPVFAVSAVRLSYAVQDWRFIRMLDLKGRETKCSLLVKFSIVGC
ncbi:related to phospholipase C [Rhynchosporium secalis]|uniref:Phosphoinositide phospholipase C n=1 Tax=Rhynchosporium secalis TaxID=38038 RepID=A0A1E1M1G5_RHYSE|nr:related to phospholipase C [Rhynchosporium secalis]